MELRPLQSKRGISGLDESQATMMGGDARILFALLQINRQRLPTSISGRDLTAGPLLNSKIYLLYTGRIKRSNSNLNRLYRIIGFCEKSFSSLFHRFVWGKWGGFPFRSINFMFYKSLCPFFSVEVGRRGFLFSAIPVGRSIYVLGMLV
jgi:hypothetical protein